MDRDSTNSPVVYEDGNERTPLISANNDSAKERRTPLPKLQIAIVIFLQIGEPLLSQSIYPYINQVSRSRFEDRWCSPLNSCSQLIRELDITGGDDRKVGYYAGFIVSYGCIARVDS